MIQTIKMNLDDIEHLASIAKALSIETRIQILKELRYKELNVNEIAELLEIPASSAALHVKVLEEAGIIKTSLQPGIRGSMKVCRIALDHVYIELNTNMLKEKNVEFIRMPIGAFVDYKVTPTCGMVSAKGPIGTEDEPNIFYHPERVDAKLIWFGSGYMEYRFPNHSLKKETVKQIELSMELCSEDHEYNLECPSDITLWINHIEVGTFFCPSDYGGRRGKLNPDWWPDKNTQYGILKTWKLNQNGCFLDEKKTSEKTIDEFDLIGRDYISVQIGNKEDAKHKGGVNLFGDCFGDYEQNIVMKLIFES